MNQFEERNWKFHRTSREAFGSFDPMRESFTFHPRHHGGGWAIAVALVVVVVLVLAR